MPAATAESTKSRLVTAAFELFETRGFEGTTADDIASRAGVGRTTFFRNFRSKEDVIFPDHERLLERIEARLAAATEPHRDVALREAARIVLQNYLTEGDLARTRYRLVSTVPTLRAREVASIQQYQRLFARFLTDWMDDSPEGRLRAELLAAGVVTAHNHVLRRWLRGETTTPEADFENAMRAALQSFREPPECETTVAVLRTAGGVDAVMSRLEPLLKNNPHGPRPEVGD